MVLPKILHIAAKWPKRGPHFGGLRQKFEILRYRQFEILRYRHFGRSKGVGRDDVAAERRLHAVLHGHAREVL